MKTVLLIRHAKSSWDDASLSDFDRPLNARGTKDADSMSQRLKKQVASIDIFLSSPAKRAKTTAEKFAAAYKAGTDQLIFDKGLYLAPESFFYACINDINDGLDTVAIFAHNPGITDFANSLATKVKTDNIPTCGIFAVSININKWKDFETAPKELLFFDYPKLHN